MRITSDAAKTFLNASMPVVPGHSATRRFPILLVDHNFQSVRYAPCKGHVMHLGMGGLKNSPQMKEVRLG